MQKFPKLETARLSLRLPTVQEAPLIVKFLEKNRDHFYPWEPLRPPEYFSLEAWQNGCHYAREEYLNDASLRLKVFLKEAPVLIGFANFTNIVRGPLQSCLLGYMLDKDYQGKGLMTEALRAGIRFIFEEQNLHRIEASYMPRNQRSANVLKRLGFEIYGEEDDYLQIAGEWERHVHVRLINQHWQRPESI